MPILGVEVADPLELFGPHERFPTYQTLGHEPGGPQRHVPVGDPSGLHTEPLDDRVI